MADEVFSVEFCDGLSANPETALVAIAHRYFTWWEENEEPWGPPGVPGDHRVALAFLRTHVREHGPEAVHLLPPNEAPSEPGRWADVASSAFRRIECWAQERLDVQRVERAERTYSRALRAAGEQVADADRIEAETDLDTRSPACWGPGAFRLFLSHTSGNRELASAVQRFLRPYGVAVFVAHEDIEPQAIWLDTIEEALCSMHALLALVTEDFHDSLWTDQEIGWALGRGVVVMAARLPTAPYGFFGRLQAFAISKSSHVVPEAQVGNMVLELLQRHHPRRLARTLVWALEHAGSFKGASAVLKALEQVSFADEDMIDGVKRAFEENSQCFNLHYAETRKARITEHLRACMSPAGQ